MDPSGRGRETWFDPGDRAQKESQRKKKKVLEREEEGRQSWVEVRVRADMIGLCIPTPVMQSQQSSSRMK